MNEIAFNNLPTFQAHNRYDIILEDEEGGIVQEATAFNASSKMAWNVGGVGGSTLQSGSSDGRSVIFWVSQSSLVSDCPFAPAQEVVQTGVDGNGNPINTTYPAKQREDFVTCIRKKDEPTNWNVYINPETNTPITRVFTFTITYPATADYVFTIRQVGLRSNDSPVQWGALSLATPKDREGNPIVVNKIADKRATVTGTLYIDVTLTEQPYGFKYFHPMQSTIGQSNYVGAARGLGVIQSYTSPSYADKRSFGEDVPIMNGLDNESIRTMMFSLSKIKIKETSGNYLPYFLPVRQFDSYLLQNFYMDNVAYSYEVPLTSVNGGVGTFYKKCDYINKVWEQTANNIGFFHSILCFPLGVIPLPNHDILPEYKIEDYEVGIGDGETTFFPCDLDEGTNYTVKINGIPTTNYTWHKRRQEMGSLWNKAKKISVKIINDDDEVEECFYNIDDYTDNCSLYSTTEGIFFNGGINTYKYKTIIMSDKVINAFDILKQFDPEGVKTGWGDELSQSENFLSIKERRCCEKSIIYYNDDLTSISLNYIYINGDTGLNINDYWNTRGVTLRLYYSNDTVRPWGSKEWVEIPLHSWRAGEYVATFGTTTFKNPENSEEDLFVIEAIYWKLAITKHRWENVYENSLQSITPYDNYPIMAGNTNDGFDLRKRGLEFTSPIPDGAVVTMDFWTDLPCKTDKYKLYFSGSTIHQV